MKVDHTVYIYKADRRTKSGERLVSTTVWRNRDAAEMAREVRELQYELWPVARGFRIEFLPSMKPVRNLMTGETVYIAHDTPRACDPSTELYWTM
jgi:hypothetical protein